MSTMSINPRTNIQDGRMEDTERRVNNQDILDEVQLVGELIYNGIMQDKTEQKTMEQVPHNPNLVCPVCNKQHRLEEIQKFRIHVKNCTDTVRCLNAIIIMIMDHVHNNNNYYYLACTCACIIRYRITGKFWRLISFSIIIEGN